VKIRVLDLFSGIGGFHLGLTRAGFEVESYFSEIDKYAIDVYSNNFKDATYVGSVTDVRGADLTRIDAITFGSPCQDFSLAGKRKGLGGDRSSLIGEAIRLISECRPRFFIWENVKGTFSSNDGADFWAIIQAFTNIGGYRLEWQLLNTKWFLPQNRERIYLVGYIGDGSRGQVFPIGESVGENDDKIKVYGDTNKGGQKGLIYDTEGIMSCLTSTDYKQPKQIKVNSATSKGYEEAGVGDSINLSVPTSKTRRGRVGKGVAQTLDTHCNQAVIQVNNSKESGEKQPYQQNRIYDANGISPALLRDKSDLIIKTQIAAMRGRNPNDTSDRTAGSPTQQMLEINKSGTSNTLTSVQKDNLVVIGDYRNDEGYRERVDGDSPTLNARAREDIFGQPIVNRIRRLTPIECERLQGFPDNWTKYGQSGEISDSQRYKMCGNAVTVDVVKEVAKRIKTII
jgi:DNA (cytosine-5)-methyltransferase 1